MKLWNWGTDGIVFSLNKPGDPHLLPKCVGPGQVAAGMGDAAFLMPLRPNQCQPLPAFMSGLAIQDECVPAPFCEPGVANCFANLQDCQAAQWVPVPGWENDFPQANGDPLYPIDIPYVPPPVVVVDGSSSTSCDAGSLRYDIRVNSDLYQLCCPPDRPRVVRTLTNEPGYNASFCDGLYVEAGIALKFCWECWEDGSSSSAYGDFVHASSSSMKSSSSSEGSSSSSEGSSSSSSSEEYLGGGGGGGSSSSGGGVPDEVSSSSSSSSFVLDGGGPVGPGVPGEVSSSSSSESSSSSSESSSTSGVVDGGGSSESSSSVSSESSSSSSESSSTSGVVDGGVPGEVSSSSSSESSSSSGVVDGGGSGGGSSSSSSDCSSGLSESLVSVLDADPDLEGYFYGEDAVNGWIVVSFQRLEFRYEALGTDNLPIAVDVLVGTEVVGTVSYPPAYVGSPIAMVYAGVLYCGVAGSSDIQF